MGQIKKKYISNFDLTWALARNRNALKFRSKKRMEIYIFKVEEAPLVSSAKSGKEHRGGTLK